MTRDPEVTAEALTDVAWFVEDDDGNVSTVFDGEVIQAELVDEPAHEPDYVFATLRTPPPDTAWLPKVPELNPRRRHPDEATPIFDELDQRRLRRKSFSKTSHDLQTALTRSREQHQLEELGHRNRVWEIEHASPLLNQLRQP